MKGSASLRGDFKENVEVGEFFLLLYRWLRRDGIDNERLDVDRIDFWKRYFVPSGSLAKHI